MEFFLKKSRQQTSIARICVSPVSVWKHAAVCSNVPIPAASERGKLPENKCPDSSCIVSLKHSAFR